jgi:nucleotide-binding universal stress UspA family protein
MELFKTILVPHDLSKSSDHALEYAINLANLTGDCDIIVFHVIPPIPLPRFRVRRERIAPSAFTNYLQRVYEELGANAFRVLDSRKEDLVMKAKNRNEAKIKNFSINTHIVIGDNAAEKIVEYAGRHKADLIVMSSRSTAPKNKIGGMLRVLLGSVSRAVSEMAPCPVLLIRPVPQGI